MSLTKYLNRSVSNHGKDFVKRCCILKPIEAEHHTIQLEAGNNVIGRSKESGIRDTRCSKKQLQLDVDLNAARINLKVLGLNPASINGVMVMQHTEVELCHGDIIEVVYGRHSYEVIFKPPPDAADSIVNNNVNKTESIASGSTTEQWDVEENNKLVIYTSAGVLPSEKIAGYDMDGTIIKTKSGNVFPKNNDDWQIIFTEVPAKLKRLYNDGYKICFFTNQSGIGRGKTNLNEFKQKIKQIVQKLSVPIQVFIATNYDYYRKPLPGMWNHLVQNKNEKMEINLEKCFFVGDAAGRPEVGSGAGRKRKDHSLADRLFAANVGISFYTPEEHFLGKRNEQWNKPDFEPSSVHDRIPLFEPETVKVPADTCELIIMVGLPGSGKSHFVKEILQPLGYTIANADTLGSTQACVKACERALSSGTSSVVDNTNVDAESRKKFIELAKRIGVKSRCFVMNVSLGQVKHNINFRELTDTTHSKISDMVFNMMKKKYKTPTLDEGFTEIVKVNIKPKFRSDREAKLYKLYLVEK